jgi:hypothetical protein
MRLMLSYYLNPGKFNIHKAYIFASKLLHCDIHAINFKFTPVAAR